MLKKSTIKAVLLFIKFPGRGVLVEVFVEADLEFIASLTRSDGEGHVNTSKDVVRVGLTVE